MKAKAKKISASRHTKVPLRKASASEILAAVKVGRAEKRLAKSAVASAKRGTYRISGSVKRASSSGRRATARERVEAK